MNYESTLCIRSEAAPGVQYRIRRVSHGRRLELLRELGKLGARLEFFEAGKGPEDAIESAKLRKEIERIYLLWGLQGIEGLEIDGEKATPAALVERGPEELVQEALRAIEAQIGLSEEERKNSWSPSTIASGARPGGSATSAGERVWRGDDAAGGLMGGKQQEGQCGPAQA